MNEICKRARELGKQNRPRHLLHIGYKVEKVDVGDETLERHARTRIMCLLPAGPTHTLLTLPRFILI